MTIQFADADLPAIEGSPEDAAYEAINDVHPDPHDESPDRCRKCGLGLVYGGRGRRPVECKRGEGCHASQSTTTPGPRRKSSGRGWQEPLRQAIAGNIASIGVVVSAIHQPDGIAILSGGDRLADSLIAVAETDVKVRRALENMVTASAWSGVALAVAGIAVPIMANHGMLPPGFGTPHPPPQPSPQPTPGGW